MIDGAGSDRPGDDSTPGTDEADAPVGGAQVLRFPTERADESAAPPGLRHLLGEVLREERHRQDRSLADVAADAAVSVQYLSEVERGRKEVSSDLLGSIHRALDLDLVDVLDRAGRRLRVGAPHRSGPTLLAA